jgi:hypothetical protein
MTTEPTPTKQENLKTKVIRQGGSEAVYGLGLIGAWIYFIGQAPTFWIGVLGFLKGFIWPVYLVFEALKYFHM